jgi:uroporphyrinogen decarboxylase
VNKRENMLSLLDEGGPAWVPAAFFIHFPPRFHRAPAGVDKHLAYFRYTNMDFVKIQYEYGFPPRPQIQSPDDWAKMPVYEREYFEDQLGVVEGLVRAAKGEALVLQTLYSAFMSAHSTSDGRIIEHMETAPEKAKQGMAVITDSVLWFVRECIKLGVDGFYASTQGGERGRVSDPAVFAECVRPYDLAVLEEIDRACALNILHVCDYHAPYDDLTPFLDYPGDVVNAPLTVGSRAMSPREAAALFGRPYMGGLDRHGIIATGSFEEIRAAAGDVLADAPERFVLGADCTLPGDIPWDHIRAAISTAHAYR